MFVKTKVSQNSPKHLMLIICCLLKISLLADLVANWDRSENILLLPESLSAVLENLSKKLATSDESFVQQLGVDLIISDYFLCNKSDALSRILRFIEVRTIDRRHLVLRY